MKRRLRKPTGPTTNKKRNLLYDFERLLRQLVETPYIYHETLIHSQTNIPIALFFAPAQATTIQLAIHGVWQMTHDGTSFAAYIGGKNKDGLLLKKLKRIEGATVTDAVFVRAKFNLFLQFDETIWLRLFCSPLRHEAYYITAQTPVEIDSTPVCQATRYCVYHKGMARAGWDE